jgi:enoyl-CoA hydratase
MIPGGGGTQRLTRIVGPNKAKELVTTGEPISAAEAARLGVVNRLASGDELADATRELVDELLSKSPLAVRQAARVIDRGSDASLPTALEYERQAILRLRGSEDAKEGVRAFLEDREPEFRGR